MHSRNIGRFEQQIRFLRRQFLQDGQLPFAKVLTSASIAKVVELAELNWRERIFSPIVTLWVFLAQVMSPDNSCRAAVARLNAHRVSLGTSPGSPATGAYCQARKRLPERFFAAIARHTGREIEKAVDGTWLWMKRRVLMFDGTLVSMPDTKENQAEYPQPSSQKPGLGFPLARIAAIFSLSTGAIIDLAIGGYSGKSQGELSLLRQLVGVFLPGDVMLADRLMCSWREMAMLKSRGVDVVTRLTSHRSTDFRRGKRLGKGDHIVRWARPNLRPVDFADNDLPDYLEVRETRVTIEHAGFRSISIILVSTLLDDKLIAAKDLMQLYKARWNNELDLRVIKETLQMNVLCCKTPELIRKEIWAHIISYNLIRAMIAQAATKHAIEPRTISFKGAMQTLAAFQPLIEAVCRDRTKHRIEIYQKILDAIVMHRVGDRPDRFEPRLRKRRDGAYDLLTKPRHLAKSEIRQRLMH
jgi:Transposase DDE domain